MSAKNIKNDIEHGPAFFSNTNSEGRTSKFYRACRFHLVLNPGKEAPYFSKHYYLMYKYTNLIKYLTKFKSFRYLISGYGLPEHETPNNHIHIYVEYKETTRLYITKVYGAHITTHIDSQLNTIQYVKDQECGIIEEIGKKALCHRPSIKEAKQMSVEELEELGLDYNNIVDKIIRTKQKTKLSEVSKYGKIKIYYLYGDSGTGKTTTAHKLIAEHGYDEFDIIQYKNGFFQGNTTGYGCCLYDEFRPSDMPVNEFIKFIDYNVQVMNIKGGHVMNKYELIIITSVINPYKMYAECTNAEETKTQWIRRMNIIKMTQFNSWFINQVDYHDCYDIKSKLNKKYNKNNDDDDIDEESDNE